MNDLVKRLSDGWHPVEISLRPERNLKLLKAAVERGFLHVKFTGTRGGTELGFPLDRTRSDLASVTNREIEAANPSGKIVVAGELVLDYVPVRVVAEINLETLDGVGRLELMSKDL